jgi:hypothetical protein
LIFILKEKMPDILITESQLELIKNELNKNENSKNSEVVNEAWYNTVMDIVGIVDPTPITDTVNAVSYFAQGDTLFGVLSLVAALPFFVGDFVAKPVMGALKIGSKATKELEVALKIAKTNPAKATEMISRLAKDPGPVGKFLQSAGGPNGWAGKVNSFIKEFPAGPFKGMKNTIMDYFTLLGKAGTKSTGLSGLAKSLEMDLKAGKAGVQDIKALRDLMKAEKVFDPALLSKPGFMNQVFFGGLPRLFRSPEGRRIRIMMQKTKWWLGFLDFIGIGNWVGESEVVKRLGSDEDMIKAMTEYQKTPEAQKYFKESFNQGGEQTDTVMDAMKQQVSAENLQDNSLAKMIRGMFMGQLNPIPGM